jgi:hypothetical protein
LTLKSAFFILNPCKGQFLSVNYPIHRAGHLKKLAEGDCIPHTSAPHSAPSTGRGILREEFIKEDVMNQAMVEKIHHVLVGNAALYARLMEVLGELHKQVGPFDGGDLTGAIKLSKDLAANYTKGTGYAGEFIDHYTNPPVR